MLYSTPVCVVKTIVPVAVAHVGWVVLATVGTVGAVAALITTVDAALVVHVLSVVLLTLKVYVFGDKPAKVGDA